MYGLITLYLGYIIYLVIFFRTKKHNFLYKEITIILGIKLIILTALYIFFFSHKMTKIEKTQKIQNIILN